MPEQVKILADIVACFKTLVLKLTEAKEGLGAVKQALTVLEVFYKKGAKANVFLQASPVDENDPSNASGAYKGNEEASMFFVFVGGDCADFECTIKTTTSEEEEEEEEEPAEFV